MCTADNSFRRLSPLIDDAGVKMLQRMREHPAAPRWSVETGDRLEREDIERLLQYLAALRVERAPHRAPPPWLLRWAAELYPHVPIFRRTVARIEEIAGSWETVGTMSREDIALRLGDVVPENADLDRLIKYGTSGTTGHPIMVPHEPRAVAHYQIFIRYLLERYGIDPGFGPHTVAGFEVCYQRATVTFATVLTLWGGGGFAKINLHPEQWPSPSKESIARFFADLEPRILTGDPISFAHLVQLGIRARPAAVLSTAIALSPALRKQFTEYFGCPVIDWYSLNETGPIGYTCREASGYHILPHDIYVEIIDAAGRRLSEGERGEITVSGGRNPFVPLLRYRTGDWARLSFEQCACGDPAPRLLDMEGREPVLFRRRDGSLVNPVDLSRTLGQFPIAQHRFVQRRDYSCELTIRPLPASEPSLLQGIETSLRPLLGPDVPLTVRSDPQLGSGSPGGKVIAYQSDFEWPSNS